MRLIHPFSHRYNVAALLASLVILLLPTVPQAQHRWPEEARNIPNLIAATADSTNRLLYEIKQWQATGTRLTGAQQARWAKLMASLNQSYQQLVSFSDQWEFARRLSPQKFALRLAEAVAPLTPTDALRQHTYCLTRLLQADRALYRMIDTLQQTVAGSFALRQRLNEGNRSFGLHYGIFEEMTATFIDAGRKRRTRSRYRQLRNRQHTAGSLLASTDSTLSRAMAVVLDDPILKRISRQSEFSARAASSVAAAGSIIAPAADLAGRTFHNLSQFFGNLVGTNLFRVASFLGIGEFRGHALPAFQRYYPSPHGKNQGVHPALAGALERQLQAGDILFEKTRFAITDKLIPGYFGHVAIYLQSYEALRDLGVFETAELQQALHGMPPAELDSRLDDYARELRSLTAKEQWMKLAVMRRRVQSQTYNGRPLNPLLLEALYRLREERQNVIEALRDGQTVAGHEGGVTLTRLDHFLLVDDFAAIRLRADAAESYHPHLARFLALALLQYGKPYDFRFDVNTLDAIVCSELIYQSFIEVPFTTEKSFTSHTITPDHVAQQAGIPTQLDTLVLRPPFALRQWYVQAMPFFPLPPEHTNRDTLINRAFMAFTRAQQGGLGLLTPDERRQFAAFADTAQAWRARESERLRHTPAPLTLRTEVPAGRRSEQRRRLNFYIELQRKLADAREAGAREAEVTAVQQRELQKYAHRDSAGLKPQQMANVLADDFTTWQSGAAYRPDYLTLLGGSERFWLAVFGAAALKHNQAFGRGLELAFAGNHEAPRVGVGYTQHYAFLPFQFQVFDNSGRARKRLQGGASLARLRKYYTHGNHIALTAMRWQNTAYATTFVPFTLAAAGDQGPLAFALHMIRLGNGRYQRGLYFGEMMRVELAPWELYRSHRAFTLVTCHYGARIQFTVGRCRAFAEGRLGERIGKWAARRHSPAVAAPQLRGWQFGLELVGSSLYRPTRHRLTFAVSEDEALFRQGRLQRERQVQVQYQWSLNE